MEVKGLQRWVLGGAAFEEHESQLRFRFRLLFVLMGFGAFSSSCFLLGHALGHSMGPAHVWVLLVHIVACLVLGLCLYGHKERYVWVAWAYGSVGLLVTFSALLTVSVDELRVLWIFLNLPGFFLLLGRRAGVWVTVLTAAAFQVTQFFQTSPYSVHARLTASMGFIYLGLFFLAYASRSISLERQLAEQNARLRHLADHDPLTGLLNRRAFLETSEVLLAGARRTGQPLAAIFLDLDHFKQVNDLHGHAAGDAVLKAVASWIQASVRGSDIAGRIGGEEFCLCLPGTDEPGALTLAEKLRVGIQSLDIPLPEAHLHPTASLGVALLDPRHRRLSDLLRDADTAMYQSKSTGRNRVTLHHPTTPEAPPTPTLPPQTP